MMKHKSALAMVITLSLLLGNSVSAFETTGNMSLSQFKDDNNGLLISEGTAFNGENGNLTITGVLSSEKYGDKAIDCTGNNGPFYFGLQNEGTLSDTADLTADTILNLGSLSADNITITKTGPDAFFMNIGEVDEVKTDAVATINGSILVDESGWINNTAGAVMNLNGQNAVIGAELANDYGATLNINADTNINGALWNVEDAVLNIADGVTVTAVGGFANAFNGHDGGIVNAGKANIIVSGDNNYFSNTDTAVIGSLSVTGWNGSALNSGKLTINDSLNASLSNSGEFNYNSTDEINGSITNYGKIYAASGDLKVAGDFTAMGANSTIGKNADEMLSSLEIGEYLTVGDRYETAPELVTEKEIKAQVIENFGSIKTGKLTIEEGFDVWYKERGEEAVIEVDELVAGGEYSSTIGQTRDGTYAYGSGKVIIHEKLTLLGGHEIENYGKLLFDGENAVVSGEGSIENIGIRWKEPGVGPYQNTYGLIAKNEAGEQIESLTIEGTLNNTGIIAAKNLNVTNGYDDSFEGSSLPSERTFNIDNLNILENGSFILKGGAEIEGQNNAYSFDSVSVSKGAALTAPNTVAVSEKLANAGTATFGKLNFADGAALVNNGGTVTAENVSGSNLVFDLATDKEKQININTLNGSNVTVNISGTTADQVVIEKMNGTGITIMGGADIADNLNDAKMTDSLQQIIDTVNIGADANNEKRKRAVLSAGIVAGEITAVTDEFGKIVNVSEKANAANQGISEMASISLMAWRQENNDMNKRLGELRDSNGEHGVWMRMTRGEAKYGAQNIKNQYNSYQLGYDEKLSVDKSWTVGAALTYTDAESSFTKGKGENKHKGFAVYGSKLNKDGSFIDLIAKYARLEHEFEVSDGAGKGDFDTNGYSISAEYGKRFMNNNGLWIEPQAELTYGRVSSADYVTNQGVLVRQNGMDSVVARLGFAAGKSFKEGNAYVRASYLYDFAGETDVTFSRNGALRDFKQDLGSGWWEVGIGTNLNFSKSAHFYLDVEKTYGGNVATPWQWNAGLRWSF